MHWLVIQLGATTLAAMNAILDKHLAGHKRIHPCFYLLTFALVGLPMALVGVIGLVPLPAWNDLALALTGGFCFALAVALYYRTVGLGEISRLIPLLRLSSLFILLLSALFFGERLHLSQYLAFTVMLAGSGLLAVKFEEKRFSLSGGALAMLVVSVLIAVSSTLVAQIYQHYALLTAFVAEQTGVAVGSALLLLLISGRRGLIHQAGTLSPFIWAVVVGEQTIRLMTGFLSACVLSQVGSAALVSVMRGMRPFLVLLLAHWLLDEPLDRRVLPQKLAGLGCMSLGMVLLVT